MNWEDFYLTLRNTCFIAQHANFYTTHLFMRLYLFSVVISALIYKAVIFNFTFLLFTFFFIIDQIKVQKSFVL